MKKIFIVMFVFFMCAGLQSAEIGYKVRVDICGFNEGIELEKGEVSDGGRETHMTWLKEQEKQNQAIVVMFPTSTDWQSGTFSFTPKKSGKLTISFKGEWKKDENDQVIPSWVLIDEISAEGVRFDNPTFKKGGKDWVFGGGKNSKASIVDGKNGKAARVSYEAFLSQDIKVQAGKPVKIIFWFKKSE